MRTILKRYPDYAKSPPEYLASIAEILAEYDDGMRQALCDIKTGVSSKCKYLPTVADIVEVADGIERERNKYRADPRAYRTHRAEPVEKLSVEEVARRKQLVIDALGYDPLKPQERREWAFQTIGVDAMRSSADLKTPNGPVSEELKALLDAQGWPVNGSKSG